MGWSSLLAYHERAPNKVMYRAAQRKTIATCSALRTRRQWQLRQVPCCRYAARPAQRQRPPCRRREVRRACLRPRPPPPFRGSRRGRSGSSGPASTGSSCGLRAGKRSNKRRVSTGAAELGQARHCAGCTAAAPEPPVRRTGASQHLPQRTRCGAHRHMAGEQEANQSNTYGLLLTDVGSGHRMRRDARRVMCLKHERQRVPAKRMQQCTQRVKQLRSASQT